MTVAEAPSHTLSPDQQAAHDAIVGWYRSHPGETLTLGGLAGTGKTTLVAAMAVTLRAEKPLKIAFVAFTGKASSVLRAKLVRAGALRGDFCGTIHSLIYQPLVEDCGNDDCPSNHQRCRRIRGWERKPVLDADLVVIDEASMIDGTLYEDLKGYGVPILAVGDHGQLPPVKGQLNLMDNPKLRLEKIHRQAEDNPIIRASMMVRETGRLPECRWENGTSYVIKTPYADALERLVKLEDLAETMVITSTNRTRCALNWKIRKLLGRQGQTPEPGEKVICLKNNRKKNIYNGLTGKIVSVEPRQEHWYDAQIMMDGAEAPFEDKISRHQFGRQETFKDDNVDIPGLYPGNLGELFDFGYCITAHKSQGSEAAQVVVFEDCGWLKTEDLRRRWSYTAFTRAKERLVVVGR